MRGLGTYSGIWEKILELFTILVSVLGVCLYMTVMQLISSISDTPRTTVDQSIRQPPEKFIRAETDPPNAAKAMSKHAHSNKMRKEDFLMSEKSNVVLLFLLTNVPSCP